MEGTASLIIRLTQFYSKPNFSAHRISGVFYSLIFFYTTFSLIGFIFNVAVVIALLQHGALTNITNIYIFCLAMSDIFLCSANMPIQAYYEISEKSNLSSSMCRILFSSFGLPLYISCLTILLIAIDRHRMIVYPLSQRMSRKKAVLLVIAVIVFSLVNSIPVAVYTDIEFMSFLDIKEQRFPTYCIESWPSKTTRLIYSAVIFCLHFFIPLFVSAALYVHIYICLNRRRVFKQKEVERKKRTNKILILVVILFAICWAPWCIFSLLLEIQGYIQTSTKTNPLRSIICERDRQSNRNNQTIPMSTVIPTMTTYSITFSIQTNLTNLSHKFNQRLPPKVGQQFIVGSLMKPIDLILKLWAMGSAVVNPFLYGWLNEPIRESMCKIWRRILRFVGINTSKFANFSITTRDSSYRPVKECGLTIVIEDDNKLETRKNSRSNLEKENVNIHNSKFNNANEVNNDQDPWVFNPDKLLPAYRTPKPVSNHISENQSPKTVTVNNYDVFLNKGFGGLSLGADNSFSDLDLPTILKLERHVISPFVKDG